MSNTNVVLFQRDPDECNDMKRFFNEKVMEIQEKRLVGKNIDLKVQFVQDIVAITLESCLAAITFGSQSVVLEINEGVISAEEKASSAYNKQVKNLNDLIYIYKRMLRMQYNLSGYITITEDQGQWDSSNPMFPVQLMADDFVTVFQDDEGNQGSDESVLVKHLYQINYNIWESIIRDAMVTGEIEITWDQMPRFLAPVISDHNNNLLAYFSYNNLKKLDEILSLPGFEEYYITEKKMFPIYFNFFGETQLTIALSAHDNKSFYRLLNTFIALQGCAESSFLVNAWFLKAFREGLEIMPLLDSQIIQTVLDASIIEHWHTWPQFHQDVSTSIKNYPNPFLVLLHDESAYKDLFEADFPTAKEDGGQVKL